MQGKKNGKVIQYISTYLVKNGDILISFRLDVFHKNKKVFENADRAFVKMLRESLRIK